MGQVASCMIEGCDRQKHRPYHRCFWHWLALQHIGDQIIDSKRRLSMIPVEMRLARVPASNWPVGSRWCAGCQTFVPMEYVGKGASRCKACSSASSHAAMVAKTYGISADQYASLLKLQGGRCAICRARPRKKRLAVDHDHASGAVRGLCCKACNRDLLGAARDSVAKLGAAVHYLQHPPMSGAWWSPEEGLTVEATRPAAASAPSFAQPSEADRKPAQAAVQPVLDDRAPGDLVLSGGSWDENGRYKLYQRRDDDRPAF